jgi:DNA-binding response OmpR family regulator
MTHAEVIAQLRDQLAEANETIRQLTEVARGPSSVRYRGVDASRSERAILEVLSTTDGIVSRRMMRRVVGAAIGRLTDCSIKTVDVSVCRLRARLRQLTPPIFIGTAWGEGYYMTQLHKDRLSALRYLLELPDR